MARRKLKSSQLAEAAAGKIGHQFSDLSLLELALTHSSKRRPGQLADNERLEFLGDRVLGLVAAQMLYQTFPGANQGELNQRFVPLVSGETCAIVAKSIGLDELLHVDSATKTSKNVLGDAIEAVIAAIYLDGGFKVAEKFIVRCWGPLFLSKFSILREPKTELQEWLIKRDGVRPIYTVINREGPAHEPIFTVELQAVGFESVTGIGRSRQGAEQSAATAFLIRESVWKEETA